MNKTLSTILVVAAVLAVAMSVFVAGGIYARTGAFGPAMRFGYGNSRAFGPGMMNGNGSYGMGRGMMGGYGWSNGANSSVKPLTVAEAKTAAQKYIQSLNLGGLEIGEVMIFENNAYVSVKEVGTGLGAFELLVDPASRLAYPEYGPNMMWNLKYGGMNHGGIMHRDGMIGGQGMMNGRNFQAAPSTNVSAEMPVSSVEAIQYAQQYLDANFAGAIAANDPTQFYGYYTLDFAKNGKILGMLSVNGYTGQIFLHTWHEAFIEEAK